MGREGACRAGRGLTAALVGLGLIAGCSPAGGGQAVKHAAGQPLTREAAMARAQQILRGTASKVHVGLRLAPGGAVPGQCSSATPRENLTYTFDLTSPQSQVGAVGLKIKAYWQKSGYRLGSSGGFTDGKPFVEAVTSDHFNLFLDWTATGDPVELGATTPCFAVAGTPSS